MVKQDINITFVYSMLFVVKEDGNVTFLYSHVFNM